MRILPRKYKREERMPSKQSNRGAGYITLQKDLESFYVAGELHLDPIQWSWMKARGLLRHF